MPAVATFLFRRELRLERIRWHLEHLTWIPTPSHLMFIRDPKPRVIAVASFENRVVHHALCSILDPILNRSYIHDTFACLPGRGAHQAVFRHQSFMQRFRFLIQVDVRKYFPSIDHAILLALIQARVDDPRVIWLCQTLIDGDAGMYLEPEVQAHLHDDAFIPAANRGLPVGALTSQCWGNFYLNGLDHFIKRDLKVAGYLRYMDDLTLFGDSRQELRQRLAHVERWLLQERSLHIRHERVNIRPCSMPVTYLGFEISRTTHRPAKAFYYRLFRRLREAASRPRNDAELSQLELSLVSLKGILEF